MCIPPSEYVEMMNNVMRHDGLLKLSEELAELQQAVSKANIVWPETTYYDGTSVKARLLEEMGDVLATMEYVADKLGLPHGGIRGRAADKLKLYKKWEVENKFKKVERPCGACGGTGEIEGNQCRVCRATGVQHDV